MLFLELGVLPLRQIIQQRRLSFLMYILIKDIKYSKFEMQDYLLPNDQKITKEEAQNILKMRSKMTNLKAKL